MSLVCSRRPVLPRARVLLAENGADKRSPVGALLAALGLEVTVADDGARAVELALAGNFDVILMAIDMPVLDGMPASALLRAAGYGGPLVALAAEAMAEDVQRYLAGGFSHCVGKPIVARELADLLAKLLAAAAPPPAASPELPGLAGLQRQFTQRLAEKLAALRAHLDAGQWEQLARLAHMLKGSASTFGHRQTGLLAGQLEQAALRADQGESARLVAALLAQAAATD